jgi:hypothetical protein
MTDLRAELDRIYSEHGRLTADLVVAAARPKRHPLHKMVFDRSVDEAAEAWYREKARDLIRSVRVVYKDEDKTGPERSVRKFHAVRDETGWHYETIEKIGADPFLTRLLLATAEREWRELLKRYSHLEEFIALVRSDLDEQKAA